MRTSRVGLSSWGSTPGFDELRVVLLRLDARLSAAVRHAEGVYGPEALPDPYRGLHAGATDVVRLLHREAGTPLLWTERPHGAEGELSAGSGRLERLGTAFGLEAFDLEVVVVALAPELDLRYERIYGYLHDDVSRRRPSVDLALNLACSTAEEKLARRANFGPAAPLLRHGILRLEPDPAHASPPLLATPLSLDGGIVHFLLGGEGFDPRLTRYSTRDAAEDPEGEAPLAWRIGEIEAEERRRGRPLRLRFETSAAGEGVAAIAAAAGLPLLGIDLARTAHPFDAASLTAAAFREARLRGALLHLANGEDVRDDEQRSLRQNLVRLAADHPGPVVLTGFAEAEDADASFLTLPSVRLDPAQRADAWSRALERVEIHAAPADIEAVALRFRLNRPQIRAAAREAALHRARRGGDVAPVAPDLFEAARARSRTTLGGLASRVVPVYGWDDIIVPPDVAARMREICQRVVHRHRVLHEWGFARKLSLGRGITALFSGPSGTGKTMAAEVIAAELGLDLYRIDLAGVVSKYIGETEKNLDRIYTAAAETDAILLFDEADALFGKRSEVQDAHDRYANIETAYLLQRMEAYEGVSILSTNLRTNMDDAFVRRIGVAVSFPMPEAADRERIWEACWPEEAPRAPDLDVEFMARTFRLSGGNIKNIVVAAAYLAATEGGRVEMAHLVRAVRREFQKIGKAVVPREFGPYASLAAAAGDGEMAIAPAHLIAARRTG
ncbi:MAG: ATP-binding protein [Gemmatimonadales bacterium]|nr:MAG: ATP-binding protein [Gemmatimonadales bacterium]